jgi:ABC-2 type transport system permease protein
MKIIWVALGKEMLEQWRSYRLLVVVLVLGLFGLLSPLGAKMMPEIFRLMPGGDEIARLIPQPTIIDAVDQYIKNHVQFGFILALLMTMGVVAQEKERGSAALVLAKPLPRHIFLFAKFAALGLNFLIGTLIAGIAAYYYTLLLFETPPSSGWFLMNVFLWVFLLVHVAITLLFSTLFRSLVAAGGLAFAVLILISLLGSLPRVGEYFPSQLASWGRHVALGSNETAWPALFISLGLILISLVTSWFAFERQEI